MDKSQLPWHTRFWGHLKTITLHKFRVQNLCFRMGLYKQGLAHDLSKYSPTEFNSGVKYWQGNRSPIEKEKEALGYSEGWLHHKGHNKHHWEYWMDKKGDQIIFYRVPKKIVKEMVADRVAASQTYLKDAYTDDCPLQYFLKGTDQYCMKLNTALLLKKYLTWIAVDGLDVAIKHIKKD